MATNQYVYNTWLGHAGKWCEIINPHDHKQMPDTQQSVFVYQIANGLYGEFNVWETSPLG